MKTKKLLTALFIFLSISISSYSQIFFHWTRMYDSGDVDSSLDVSKDAGGLFHQLGTRHAGVGDKLLDLIYDDAGNLMTLYSSNKHLPGEVISFIRDENYNTYVVSKKGTKYFLSKYSNKLKEIWKQEVSATISGVKLSPAGDPVIGGTSGNDFFLRKYNRSTAAVIWTGGLPGVANGNVAFNADAAGFYYLASNFANNLSITKYDPNGVNAVISIVDLYGGVDISKKIFLSPSGEVYLSAVSDESSVGGVVVLVKFSTALFYMWKTDIGASDGSGLTEIDNVLFDPGYNPEVIGSFISGAYPSLPERVFVTKRNLLDGMAIYISYPNDPGGTLNMLHERSLASVSDASGNIYFGGYTDIGAVPGSKRWSITKVDHVSGTRLWTEADVLDSSLVNDILVTPGLDVYLSIYENGELNLTKYSQTTPRKKSPHAVISSAALSVYPNPSNRIFHLDLGEQPANIYLFNSAGKLIESDFNVAGEFTFGENLASGIYFMKVISGEVVKQLQIVKSE